MQFLSLYDDNESNMQCYVDMLLTLLHEPRFIMQYISLYDNTEIIKLGKLKVLSVEG